jgi:hypothetical protein
VQFYFTFSRGNAGQNHRCPPLIRPVSAYFLDVKRLLPNSALITPRMHGFMMDMAKASDARPTDRAPGHQANITGGD